MPGPCGGPFEKARKAELLRYLPTGSCAERVRPGLQELRPLTFPRNLLRRGEALNQLSLFVILEGGPLDCAELGLSGRGGASPTRSGSPTRSSRSQAGSGTIRPLQLRHVMVPFSHSCRRLAGIVLTGKSTDRTHGQRVVPQTFSFESQ